MPTVDLVVYSLLGVTIFALINIFSSKMNAAFKDRKHKVLSFFGGITATYVFLDLLPTLQQSSQYFQEIGGSLVALYEDAIFLVVLVGFLVFFILEHLTFKSRRTHPTATRKPSEHQHTSRQVFVVYLATSAFLVFVLSFVLVFEFNSNIIGGLLFATGVSMHLVISDNALIEHHKTLQVKYGRYVLGTVPFLGWIASVVFPEGIAQAYALLAFISGVILYHSIRNEMPTSLGRSSLAFFLIGAVFYALLLIGHVLFRALS
jgi:hypothetical protein